MESNKDLSSLLIDFIWEQKLINKELRESVSEQKVFNEEQKVFNAEIREFVSEQKVFNAEIREFVSEQKTFNINIDRKVDKVQYFLEESLTANAKMFYEEQLEMKTDMRWMEEEISHLKNELFDLSSRVNLLFKTA